VRSLIFDATALVALFNGNERVSALWMAAEEVSAPVVLPTAAVAIANRKLKASDNAWSAILFGANVYALDLSMAAALGASRELGDLDVAHTSYEALATGGTIVTGTPKSYDRRLRAIAF
jgi:hypothetical protein